MPTSSVVILVPLIKADLEAWQQVFAARAQAVRSIQTVQSIQANPRTEGR